MDEELKKLVNNRKLVSFKVSEWIGIYTKGEVCEILEFSRPTLERRLSLHNWRVNEIEKIMLKMPF